MTSLRDSIERADRERQQKEFENQQRIKRDGERRRQQESLQKQNDEQLIVSSRRYFDRHLVPIFQEVAGAKQVALTSPYEYRSHGLFGGLRTATRPIKGGLEIIEVVQDYDHTIHEYRKFGETRGKLIWNVEPKDDFDASEYSYSFLSLGVTSEALGYTLNDLGYPEETFLLSQPREIDRLVENIFEKMSRGSHGYYSWRYDNSSM